MPAPWPAVALALLIGAAPAAAHDTWFQPLPPSSASAAPALALGTGNRISRHETAIGTEFLAHQGCSDTSGRVLPDPMTLLRYEAHATVLQPPAAARTCWAQLAPLTVALAPAMVAVYLDEIQATDAVRRAWAAQQRRGVAWQERYTKHARIDLGDQAPSVPAPVPMAMDVLRQTAPDGGHRITLLRDGRPLPGLPVELRHDASPIGLWRRTDAQGRVELPPLPAGRWVLRGTELRLSEDRPDTWDSGFLTLAFEVQAAPPAPAGPGSGAER